MVLAFAAIRAGIVAIIDVSEGCHLELCVFQTYDQQKFTMFLGQWIAASAFEKARVGGASSTPPVPPTLGEALPSTTADNRADKTPQ